MLEVTLYYAAEADPIEQTFLQNKNNVYHCHSHIISYRFDPNLWDNGLLLHEFHHHQGLHQLTVVYALREKEVAK